jgi:hypothetical protein
MKLSDARKLQSTPNLFLKDMIDDIVKSFENMLSSGDNSNPFAGIMGLSQEISMKYANKINSGDLSNRSFILYLLHKSYSLIVEWRREQQEEIGVKVRY